MINWPNLLLVAGSGRNVGKTTFVCKLIEQVAKHHAIIAIKITPHIHSICSHCKVLMQSDHLVIAEELSQHTVKDSSRMLAAGAQKVYFVQAGDEKLGEVIDFFKPLIGSNKAIVCESAALRNLVKPAVFVLMSKENLLPLPKNNHFLEFADQHIVDFRYDITNFTFEGGNWVK